MMFALDNDDLAPKSFPIKHTRLIGVAISSSTIIKEIKARLHVTCLRRQVVISSQIARSRTIQYLATLGLRFYEFILCGILLLIRRAES